MPRSPLLRATKDGDARSASWRSREGAVALALTVLTLAVRFFYGRQGTYCGTPDACNYLGLAQSLAGGHGFHARFLFNLQQDVLTLPNRAIEYWRPGTSFFLLLAKPLGGVTLNSSMAIAALAGVALAAAAWTLAIRATDDRRTALFAYLLCLVLPAVWAVSMTPDSVLFYASAVAWFLALFTVRRQGLLQDVLGLAMIGVAYSIRNDAVLLLVPMAAVLWLRWRRKQASLTYVAAMLAVVLLALAPVHVLNAIVLGKAFPSTTGRVLYMTNLSDFELYPQAVTLHTLLARGMGYLVKVRIETFALVVYRNLALGVGFAVVFLPAVWLGRKDKDAALPEMWGAAVFLATMMAVYTLVLPVIGVFSALRSFVGLLPLTALLAVLGVQRLARDRRMASALLVTVLAAYFIAGLMVVRRQAGELKADGDRARQTAELLASSGAQKDAAIVMTQNPIQFSVTTGFAAVASPSNGPAAGRALADTMHVTHVLLDETNTSTAEIEQWKQALQPAAELRVPDQHLRILRLERGK